MREVRSKFKTVKNNKLEYMKKRGPERNKARKEAENKGKVKKGDGKDVDHPTHNTKSKKVKILPKSQNRSKNLKKGGITLKKIKPCL